MGLASSPNVNAVMAAQRESRLAYTPQQIDKNTLDHIW